MSSSGRPRSVLRSAALWKAVGLAGLVGVTATGVLAVRDERQRRAYSPDQIRERLHARLAALDEAPAQPAPDGPTPSS